MLEKMSDFFEKRLSSYDLHMLNNIYGAREFYPYTAAQLPTTPKCRILDLGCGTGLELEEYLSLNPSAIITGIDVSDGMLNALRSKFDGKGFDITLIRASYLDTPLGEALYDGAVSVESLHHFTKEEKVALYKKVHAALKSGGCFILTDYFASSDAEEQDMRNELKRLREEEQITDSEHYHFDTPLTVEHEIDALREAGFGSVTDIKSWGATHTVRAVK